jgi:dihydroorotate dehydrogenase electron transfer subunit
MKTLKSEILSNTIYGPGIYRMEVFSPYIVKNIKAGQFINIRCSPEGMRDPLLRRPFSVFDIEKKFNVFSILYLVKGRGTAYMASLGKGDIIDFAGPLGKPIPLPESADSILLIGGGMGIAPLNLIARLAVESSKTVQVIAGFRDSALLRWERDLIRMNLKYRIFSEDGSWGQAGLVCDHIYDEPRIFRDHDVFCCGPVEMLKVLKQQLDSDNISATALLEEKMACGIGACNGCVIKVKKKDGIDFVRVCREGPAFDLSEVIFE